MDRTEGKTLAKYGQVPRSLSGETVFVTPNMAAAWLESSQNPRRLSQQHVDRLADDMRRGEWKLTHQAIALGSNGELIDGFHRSWAIVLAGVGCWMRVTRGVSREDATAIDTGKGRMLHDRLTAVGTWGKVERMEAACLRQMLRGRRSSLSLSATREQESWRRHKKAVQFALSVFPVRVRTLTNAPVSAAIARAYYAAPRVDLREFGRQLVDPDAPDGIVPALRRTLNRTKPKEHFVLTERALWLFLNRGQAPGSLDGYGSEGELYPIVEDK